MLGGGSMANMKGIWERGMKKSEIIDELKNFEIMDIVDIINEGIKIFNDKFKNTVIAKETKKTIKLRLEVEFEPLSK